jgi:hypothetical protein
MSRGFVGDWADKVDPSKRPVAIVALGVLVAELWTSREGGGEPEEVSAGGPDRIAEAFRGSWNNLARIISPKRLRWGHHDEARWETFKKHFSPEAAAEGWSRFIRTHGEIELWTWSDFHSSAKSDDETWAWLTRLTWDSSTGVRSIFVSSWHGHRQAWHWPLRLGFLGDSASQTLLEEFHRSDRDWIRRLTSFVDVEQNGLSCDLLLSPLDARQTRDALLRARARATAVALIGSKPFDTSDEATAAEDLERTAEASAVAFLPVKASLELVVEIIRQISHDHPFDVAVHLALRSLASDPPLVVAREDFIENSRISRLGERWAERLDRLGSSDAANRMRSVASSSYLSELGAASELAELAKTSDAKQSHARYLQAATWRLEERHRSEGEETVFVGQPLIPASALVAEHWHVVGVSISPLLRKASSQLPPFPDDQIGWDGGPQEITIVIVAPDCNVASARLELIIDSAGVAYPRGPDYLRFPVTGEEPNETASAQITAYPSGPSEMATFLLAPHRTGEVKARVMAVHGNRILQTAILQAPVLATLQAPVLGPDETREGEIIRLVPEGLIRSSLQDLEDRRFFDLAILTNDSLTGERQITAVSDQDVLLRDFGGFEKTAERVGERLRELVEEPEAFGSPDSDAMTLALNKLAHEGVLIRDGLIDCGLGGILRKDPSRIQIVSARPDDVLPLEFIYDGPAPDPKNAIACPAQTQALARASCGDCPNRTAATHVCAMRFWGLRKVIERHLYDAETAPLLDRVTSRIPSPELERIAHPKNRIFACSLRAGKFPEGPAAIQKLKQRLGLADARTLDPSIAEPSPLTFHSIDNWVAWRDCVRDHAPTLMVLLPHTDVGAFGEELQIGEADALSNAQIDSTVVGTKPPVIVVLLGCETASTKVHYASFVARFRTAEAAVVIGTLTLVLGRHAALVADTLVEQLERYWSEPFRTATVGDVITDIRRRLMQKGLPIGLAVVAFGDADWLLGG